MGSLFVHLVQGMGDNYVSCSGTQLRWTHGSGPEDTAEVKGSTSWVFRATLRALCALLYSPWIFEALILGRLQKGFDLAANTLRWALGSGHFPGEYLAVRTLRTGTWSSCCVSPEPSTVFSTLGSNCSMWRVAGRVSSEFRAEAQCGARTLHWRCGPNF